MSDTYKPTIEDIRALWAAIEELRKEVERLRKQCPTP